MRGPLPTLRHGGTTHCACAAKTRNLSFSQIVFLLIRLRFDWRAACKSPYSSARSISFFLSSFLSQTIVPSETKSVGFAINMSTALLVERLDAALCSGSGKNDDAVGLPTETD